MQSSFNNLTQLAAVLNATQIASLMLLKNEELYCKSSEGITKEALKQFQSVFESSLLKSDEYNCILNIWNDNRFNNLNRLKHFPDIKSYHSYRIKTKSGKLVGLFVILKNEETALTVKQINGLNLLAVQVVKLLELKRKKISLRQCRKQLKKTTKKVDDFASMAAHDLKAPIRNIKSFVDLLKSEEKRRDNLSIYFDYIDTSITKMNLLIEGLMDYAQTDLRSAQVEAVNLDTLVSNAFKDSVTGLDLDSLSLKKETLPVIFSHSVLLAIVVQNLISNAVKYHKEHPIELRVTYKSNNGFHYLEFSDNGIGIDPIHYNEIFKPFKRLHTQSEFEGSGLGLATCKRILTNLKGSISVSSKLEQGSTFSIKMPVVAQL